MGVDQRLGVVGSEGRWILRSKRLHDLLLSLGEADDNFEGHATIPYKSATKMTIRLLSEAKNFEHDSVERLWRINSAMLLSEFLVAGKDLHYYWIW